MTSKQFDFHPVFQFSSFIGFPAVPEFKNTFANSDELFTGFADHSDHSDEACRFWMPDQALHRSLDFGPLFALRVRRVRYKSLC